MPEVREVIPSAMSSDVSILFEIDLVRRERDDDKFGEKDGINELPKEMDFK
jgi:hypothetical protein